MRRPPGVLKCLLLLATSDFSLRVLGFARTTRLARFLGGNREAEVADQVIRQTLHNIIVATALYPGRSKCLEQTVASFVRRLYCSADAVRACKCGWVCSRIRSLRMRGSR
jgi:hypothetical protein